jgi:hypothetical protein
LQAQVKSTSWHTEWIQNHVTTDLFVTWGGALPAASIFLAGFLEISSQPETLGYLTLLGAAFVLLPTMTLLSLASRSPLLYPYFAMCIVLGFALVLARPSDVVAASGNPPLGMVLTMAALAVLCGSVLFQRGFAQRLLQRESHARKAARYRVDALARIKVIVPFKADSHHGGPPPPNPVCVVIRDVSALGLGVYGFPADIHHIMETFQDQRSRTLTILYRNAEHTVEVESRWWRSDLRRGECGLRFVPGTGVDPLVRALVQDASTGDTPPLLQWIDSNRMELFGLAIWSFSVLGLLCASA